MPQQAHDLWHAEQRLGEELDALDAAESLEELNKQLEGAAEVALNAVWQ